LFPEALFVYAQNITGLQVQNVDNPVILNIFIKSVAWLFHPAGSDLLKCGLNDFRL